MADDGPPTVDVLSQRQQAAIHQAFRVAAEHHQLVDQPRSSVTHRWIDLPLAAVYAADEVEMAIVEKKEGPDACHYRLVTVEDQPAWLDVIRTGDERIYQASARVGLFNDQPERAARLLDALAEQMELFAAKRRFNGD